MPAPLIVQAYALEYERTRLALPTRSRVSLDWRSCRVLPFRMILIACRFITYYPSVIYLFMAPEGFEPSSRRLKGVCVTVTLRGRYTLREIRTPDAWLRRPTLCPLSYEGKDGAGLAAELRHYLGIPTDLHHGSLLHNASAVLHYLTPSSLPESRTLTVRDLNPLPLPIGIVGREAASRTPPCRGGTTTGLNLAAIPFQRFEL